MSKRTNPNPPVPPNHPHDDLNAWLKKQAAKLKSLEAKGNRLKIDFVQNAKEKGEILLEAEKRASKIPARFYVWVVQDAQIGESTARLYMDVAKNYDDVKERFANSNPLEMTLRKVRDAIRDARQKRGEGKPGSGRKKAGDANTPPTGNAGDKAAAEPDDTHIADAENQNHVPAIADARQAKEAGQPGDHDAADRGGTTEADPMICKVMVTVFSENDQSVVLKALSNYSPISESLGGSAGHLHFISAHFQARQYGTLLQKLGKAIDQCRGQTVPSVRIHGYVPPSVPPK